MELNNEFMGDVLGVKLYRSTMAKHQTIFYNYTDSKIDIDTESLYETMSTIKKWASVRDYILSSFLTGCSVYKKGDGLDNPLFNTGIAIGFHDCNIEFEAVYKAGLWVFEKLKEHNND